MTTVMIDEVSALTEEQFKACEVARARGPTERPIMFSAEMVQAILDGSKTQTRRVARRLSRCSAGVAGDRLWVRETWCQPDPLERQAVYRADAGFGELEVLRDQSKGAGPRAYVPWRSSMHMPRWAARILLEVTDVRLEHLQEISAADALREGVSPPCIAENYARLWESLNGKREGCAWRDNPWVWVIGFRRLVP